MAKPNKHPKDARLKVQQHHAVGSSASAIMAKHLRGPNRLLPPQNPTLVNQARKPEYRYMSSEHYHDMLNKVRSIDVIFYGLPARTRQRFSNDPYTMLKFIEDEQNRKECLKLGLLEPTDDEFDQMSLDDETQRQIRLRAAQEAAGQQTVFPKADPEANPDYGRKASAGAGNTPQKGGAGGQ